MMGISKGSSKALCFVIDTTGSMSDDIAAVKAVTSFIINSKVGTDEEPSVYILVPFNDPGGIFMPQTRLYDTCFLTVFLLLDGYDCSDNNQQVSPV